MIIVVKDANIIIDIIDLGLYQSIFKLKFKFITSDIIVSEIKRNDQADIIKKMDKLEIVKFDEQDLIQIINYSNKTKQLSFADCSVIYLSKKENAILLTGDKAVRNFAEGNGIKCHGILWLINQMVENDVITKEQAIQNLNELKYRNNRLPKLEIDNLIDRYLK